MNDTLGDTIAYLILAVLLIGHVVAFFIYREGMVVGSGLAYMSEVRQLRL